MSIHEKSSQFAGKTIKVKQTVFAHGGKEFEVRDWWDRCSGLPWSVMIPNPVCTTYAIRASFSGNPQMFDNEVLYGRIGPFMYLMHVSELDLPHSKPQKK